MNSTVVFVHGTGRSGPENWPTEVGTIANADYLTMPGYGAEDPVPTRMSDWVDCILAHDGDLHVVAHSFGGISAILAAAQAPRKVRSLTLFEPAAYSYARGQEHIEAAIARMSPVVARAPFMTAADYLIPFVTALSGSAPPRPEGAEELRAAERFRLLAPIWSFDLPADVLSAVPTQVLTGAWSDEYEEIARAMARAGARHTHLTGFGHRVQDHPDAAAAIQEWAGAHP